MRAFISGGLQYKNSDALLSLYKALVRPDLEYCAQFWGKFTRMIPGKIRLTYDERLMALGLMADLVKWIMRN